MKFRLLSVLALAAACGGAGSPGDEIAENASFPVDPYPAKCGVSSIDSFEKGPQPWHASNWASVTLDAPVSATAFGASSGSLALNIPLTFTGNGYEQGYVGREGLNLSVAGCASIAVDVTLPAGAPAGMRGSIILLLGASGAWNGQADPVALTPGGTVTVRLPLAAAIDPVPSRALFKQVVGIGLKVDGMNIAWSGPLAMDNVRVENVQPPSAADTGAFSVGTFGGFEDSTGGNFQIPTRNGFLTWSAESAVQGHALLWPRLGANGGDLTVGSAFFGSTLPAFSPASLEFHDWVTLRSTQSLPLGGTASAWMSRAFPAVRYTSDRSSFTWQGGATHLALVQNGAVVTLTGSASLSSMSEPWALAWSNGAPTLITFQRRPQGATFTGGALRFDFASAMGSVQVMPLYGVSRGGWSFDDAVVQARFWLQALAAFPTSLHETYTVNDTAQTVIIADTYGYESIADDWGTQPLQIAAVPPSVWLASTNGYPVHFASTVTPSSVATWFGPYAFAQAGSVSFTIPMSAALTREPVPLRVNNSTATAPIRTELERVLTDEVPADPQTYWLGNDVADAQFLCDAWATLTPGSAARAKAADSGIRLAENAFLGSSTAMFTEPVSGQQYLAPTWYPEQNLPFDKEWNTGRQLAGLVRCSEAIDLDLARGAWPRVLAMYRYHRIFQDWATGSVTSSTLGLTELADGMHFAWDGQLGVGRLAKKLGDTATWQDAAYRASRQQLALYAAWFQAAWTKQIDYAIGHISNAYLPPDEVETRGAIDGWVEDFGLATLEFTSFWETTNFLYFDVPAQLSLYRDYGLEQRVHALEYDIMPAFHPLWTDGDVMDPVDQRYYGSNYTDAHLYARGALFHDDPATLYQLYTSSRGSQASQQWYTMYWHGLAGPTLLAIERGHAPLLEAPVGAVRMASSAYDASSNKVSVDFQAIRTGTVTFRTRKPGGTFKSHAFSVTAGKRYTSSFAP
ncbi:MAG TPA: hypothetical protein VLW85_02565 [Myxococcales bacterium]|nr:hypothetical protein [Myxococcales bacterium]